MDDLISVKYDNNSIWMGVKDKRIWFIANDIVKIYRDANHGEAWHNKVEGDIINISNLQRAMDAVDECEKCCVDGLFPEKTLFVSADGARIISKIFNKKQDKKFETFLYEMDLLLAGQQSFLFL